MLKPYEIAWKIRRKQEDERDWMQGMYFAHAIAGVMSKNGKYPEKPAMQDVPINEQDAERIKMQKVNALFASLGVMQSNFELTKKVENQDEE